MFIVCVGATSSLICFSGEARKTVKGVGGVPLTSTSFFLLKKMSAEGGGVPLTAKLEKVFLFQETCFLRWNFPNIEEEFFLYGRGFS